jgi:hypothetical protein
LGQNRGHLYLTLFQARRAAIDPTLDIAASDARSLNFIARHRTLLRRSKRRKELAWGRLTARTSRRRQADASRAVVFVLDLPSPENEYREMDPICC